MIDLPYRKPVTDVGKVNENDGNYNEFADKGMMMRMDDLTLFAEGSYDAVWLHDRPPDTMESRPSWCLERKQDGNRQIGSPMC